MLLIYGLLNMSSVQNYIKEKLVTELRHKLQTDLNIESLNIKPFNKMQLNGVYINDRDNNTILQADKIYAGVDILPFLLKDNLVISDARLSDFEIYLSKDSANAPLNIQFIIDAFKPKDDGNKNKIDIKINSVNIANGNFHFDVKNRPYETHKFDPNHISVSDLNAKLALKSLSTDSLNIQIKKLKLKEKSGLVIENLIARFITQGQYLSVKGFSLSLPKSLLRFEKFDINSSVFRVPADLLSHATFDAKIASSYVALRDIKAFVPAFEHFEDRILFNTNIKGKIDSIAVSDIALYYGEKMQITAEGFIQDIRNTDKTFVKASINNLTVSEDGIIGIMNNLSKEKKDIPPILSNLGTLSFRGDISGYLKHMNAKGNLHSQLGDIDANAIIGINPDKDTDVFFDGKVETDDFKLGQLLDNKDLDNISFDLMANITKPKQGKLKGKVDGGVHDFTFKRYTYHNIIVDGKYDGSVVDGGLSLDDPNAIFRINGLFDMSAEVPKMNFGAKLKNVRLDNLNLSEKYKDAYLSFNLDADFSGKSIDDLQGSIRADSVTFLQSGKRFAMDNFRIEASGQPDERLLNIQSDIINGKVTGAYSFSTIAESLKKTLSAYLPALANYQEKQNKPIKENNLLFELTINNTENLSDVFNLPVTIYSPAKIIGFYDNQIERFKIEGYIPSMNTAGTKLQSGYIVLQNTDDDKLISTISGSFVTKNGTVNDLSVDLTSYNDVIDIRTLFFNEDNSRLKGEFSNSVSFSRAEDRQLQTDLHFNPGELVLNNTLWKVNKSRVRIKGQDISVNGFSIQSDSSEQELDIDGTYSQQDEDERLNIRLKNIDLDYIFTTLAIDALQFGGAASGSLYVSSIQSKPYADVNLNVTDFSFNKTNLGYLELSSDLDTESLKVNMRGQITNENDRKTAIDGFINPLTQELSINFDAEEVNMAFLNKYVATLFNNVQGRGKGNVHLFGDFSNVTVEGTAFVQDGGVGINFLNTYYTFTDTVYMKKDLIYFSDISFNDEKGNIAKVSGRVAHDYFTNFMYYVNLAGTNFMLYNATEKMNPMFYGTVYASGTGTIKGDEQVVDLNMNIKTDKNTSVYMNFMEETAEEYSFITYKTPDTGNDSIATANGNNTRNRLTTESGIEMNMNFYVDATPDATVDLLMDPVGGDRIKGKGSGALQFVWGSNKDPMLYGTYNILQGSYNFTFQKLMERVFIIQDGSTVQFRGDPFQANIDITALYRVIANLNDLDRNLVELSGQSNIPVNCLLDITGPLKRPNVEFDIQLPNADPEVQRQVKSLMATEDMMNRQIVYLLILSKFYTPNYAITDQRTTEFAALASATLSTQLSKILSKIDDRWQIGTSIRTSDTDLSNTEVELILSSRLLNDRVLFNGNFGYRDNIYTEDAFIGDIDIEVLLNRMGTWRLKAYNHYNEKYYYIKNATQTQGIGIVYKRDFDDLRELFRRPKKTLKPVDNDTLSRQDTVPLGSDFVIMKK